MKVTSVELHPDRSPNFAVLSYQDLNNKNPYNVKGIVGLDPQDIMNYQSKGLDNSDLNDLFLLPRTITIAVELNPFFADGEDFSVLRDNLYKLIWTSRRGLMHVQFFNGTNVVAEVDGVVRKMESPQFSKTQQVQITIQCEKSMLTSPNVVDVDVSNFNHSRITVYDKDSNAPHGFNFLILFNEDCPSFKMTNVYDDGWAFEVIPIGGFLDGDLLLFSSALGDKLLYINRGTTGPQIHLADRIVSGSVWPLIFPGANTFELIHSEKFEWEFLSYFPTYWGI